MWFQPSEWQEVQWWTPEGHAVLAERRARIRRMKRAGCTFPEIALAVGGTADGVRGTYRKMARKGRA